jgi:hypothetical protein
MHDGFLDCRKVGSVGRQACHDSCMLKKDFNQRTQEYVRQCMASSHMSSDVSRCLKEKSETTADGPADPGTSRVARVDFNRGLLLRPDEVLDRADTSGLRPYRSTRVTARGIAQVKATPLVEAVQAQGVREAMDRLG